MSRSRFLKILLPAIALSASSLTSTAASADEESSAPPDQPRPTVEDQARTVDRTWLYVDDASLPAPLRAVAITRATYTSEGASPTRPFASNVATPGAMLEMGGEVGLLDRLSLTAVGVAGEPHSALAPQTGAVAGLRLSILPASWQSTHAVLS